MSESVGSTDGHKDGLRDMPKRSSMYRDSAFRSPHRAGTYRPGSERFRKSAYPIDARDAVGVGVPVAEEIDLVHGIILPFIAAGSALSFAGTGS